MQQVVAMLVEKQNLSIIFIGLIGFVFLLLYDVASLKKIKNRVVMAYAGYVVQVYAIIRAVLEDNALAVSQWIRWAGWPLTLAGASWLLYCLFLFTPLRQTYYDASGPALTTEGPYALSRHPGVYGYTVFIIGLALISRSLLLFQGGLIWSLANVGYVFIQDKYIFPRLLTGYHDYRNQVPMLIPNAKSIRRFWNTK